MKHWAGSSVVQLLLAAIACSSIVDAVQDRSGAFIGYSETASYGHCQDKLESCEKDASLNKCLTDPYNMRRFCPVSCAVTPCVSTGSLLDKFVFKGHASQHGTAAYSSALAGTVGVNHFNSVDWGLESPTAAGSPALKLMLSSLGLGTYLGDADDATDEQVLSAVLYSATRGWNVIDTASNYRNGRAESTIGRALSLLLVGSSADQFPAGRFEVTRDALFISTKAGFLNPALKQQLLDQGAATTSNILGGTHCLTPPCIRASVSASLTKLRLETLDLVYLHNAAEVQLLALGREQFFEVLRGAFKELEALRQEGKIRGYGLATWDCFRQAPGAPLHLRLEEVVKLAKEVGGEHHGFMAIQLPINVKMTEAFKPPWQPVVNQAATKAAADAAAAAIAAATPPPSPPPPPADTLTAEDKAEDAALAAMTPPAAPPPPPPPPPPIIYDNMTLLEAAKKLQVLVFVSGPLMEAQLLQGAVGPLDHILGLKDARSTAAKLVQYVRSIPGVAGVLLGQKAQEHVEANVALAAQPRLADKMWEMVSQQIADAMKAHEEQRQLPA